MSGYFFFFLFFYVNGLVFHFDNELRAFQNEESNAKAPTLKIIVSFFYFIFFVDSASSAPAH